MNKHLIGLAALLAAGAAQALTVTETNDAGTLVSALLAGTSGITVEAGSVGVIGLATQSGTFSGFSFAGNGTAAAPAIGLGNGVVLTSGRATVPTTNTEDAYTGVTDTGESATITAITGLPSADQNRIGFAFTTAPDTRSVAARFVFASEEYPEFAGSQYADGFAFVVDGVNYARFQDGSAVSLLSLQSNANLFDNAASVYGIEYDGLTPVLTVTGLLNPGVTRHTLEIVVADTSDQIYDSAVFLTGLAVSGDDGGITPGVPEPQTWAMFAAGLGLLGTWRGRRAPR